MKTFSKTRKFVTVAPAAAAPATSVLATANTASAGNMCHWNWYWNQWMCN